MTYGELAQIITAITALLSIVVAIFNHSKINEVHLLINSRMDQLLKTSNQAAHLSGRAEAETEGNIKAAAVAEGVKQGEDHKG